MNPAGIGRSAVALKIVSRARTGTAFGKRVQLVQNLVSQGLWDQSTA